MRSAFEAVALKGVLETLLQDGVVIVATSNRAPTELNQQGLQEDLFLHFVASLLDSCDIVPLDTGVDYRRSMWQQHTQARSGARAGGDAPGRTAAQASAAPALPEQPPATYLCPATPANVAAFDAAWEQCVAGAGEGPEEPCTIPVMYDRQLAVPRAAGGCARLQFADLCGTPKGSADYLALATRFDTVFIEGIPAMSMQARCNLRLCRAARLNCGTNASVRG